MLDLSTAVLCDFAQVRDRLLFVSSGAVSRLYRQELPSPLGLMVGLVIEVPLEDAGMEHRLRAEVINRHGTVLATLDNTFRVSDAGLFPHEVQQVPLVLSITGVRARTWGTHQVRLYLDDDLVRALTLYVVPAAAPQSTVRAAEPTQSRVADDEGTVGVPPARQDPFSREDPFAPSRDMGPAEATPDAPTEEPSPEAEPVSQATTDDDDRRGESVTWGEPDAADPDPEPAEVELQLDPELDLEVEPSRDEPTQSAPAWRTPTIDAEAAAPAPAPQPRPQVFDFDEDDLDADPAQRPSEAKREASRFSFRYRYEDDDQ